jgi:transcriptional regulator with XRE-family HTH domain
MSFSKTIKELRRDKELTQRELAAKLDIGQATVSQWENGNYEPSASAIRQLAIFFDVTADYLLELEDYGGNKIKF